MMRTPFTLATAVALLLPMQAGMSGPAGAQQIFTHRQIVQQLRVAPGVVAIDPAPVKRRGPPPRVMMRAPQPDEGRVARMRAPEPDRGRVAAMRAPEPVFVDEGPHDFAPPPTRGQVARMRAPEPEPKAAKSRAPARAKPQKVAAAEPKASRRGLDVRQAPPEPASPSVEYPGSGRIDLEILFEYDSDRIDPKSVKQLVELGEALNDPALGEARFMVAGHTDAAGSDGYNDDLSRRRARAVTGFLVGFAGVDAGRLVAEGFGESLLKYPDAPESGQNRRVEIINLGGEG